jgi:hypothetical protein
MLNLRNRDGTNNDSMRDEVADVQNYNKNQYKRVLELEKDWVKRWTDDVKPHTQLDRTVEQRTEKESEKVISLLQSRIDSLDKLYLIGDKIFKTTDMQNRSYLSDLTENSEIIRFYNDLIRSYIDLEISQDTREAIKTNIQSLKPYIDALVYGIQKIIIDKNFSKPGNHLFNQTYLLKLITGLSIYTFIQKSLFRGTYSTITKNEIDFQLNQIVSKFDAPQTIIYNDALVGNNITKSQKDAEDRRIQLLTDDQNKDLSPDQILQLQRSIFGANLVSRGILSPAELNALQPDERQIEEYRRAETEAQREQEAQNIESRGVTEEQQRQQTEQRILAGLPPINIESEGVLPTQQYEGEKQDLKPTFKKEFETEKLIFDDKVNEEYNTEHTKFITELRKLQNKFNQGNLDIPGTKPIISRIKDINKTLWEKFINLSKNRALTLAEEAAYANNLDLDFPILTTAKINSLFVANGPYIKANARGKDIYKESIYEECQKVGQDMDKQRDEMLKIYEDKKKILGFGKHYHRKFVNNSNLYFNDDKNDYYNN